jgi:hypothetical protein
MPDRRGDLFPLGFLEAHSCRLISISLPAQMRREEREPRMICARLRLVLQSKKRSSA